MKQLGKAPAFTLLEMIIAITVFTIFIGFAIATYLTFHRADQEALAMRSVLFETQGTMDLLTEAVKENAVDYDYYNEDSAEDVLSDAFDGLELSGSHTVTGSTLVLRSADGTQLIYTWDSEEETLSLQAVDADGVASDPTLLHNETTRVTYAQFRIFPDMNPYENATESAVQYQPTVRIELTFAVPGRINEEVTVDLQTSVTSRFYQ